MKTLFLSELAARLQRDDSRPVDVRYQTNLQPCHQGSRVDVKPSPNRENTWFFAVLRHPRQSFAALEQPLCIDPTGTVVIRDVWGEEQVLHLSITRPVAAEDFS